jgi:N-acetyl-1-D-myo-inositol-2-amino-2-deoxy-alpha-D-glucopyranoside deacetylase
VQETRPDESSSNTIAERVLFVHAHPDDETIATGGTIATLVDSGVVVTVLTCTRGELGEVIPDDIRSLEGSDGLASHRERELAAAMGILGVRDHRYLGAAGARWPDLPPRRYTDSGMRWGASGAEALDSFGPGTLCAAEIGEVAADIAAVIADMKPTAVVSYDANGGYGHPDHIRAHEAARRAAEVMGVPFFEIEPENAHPSAPDVAGIAIDVTPVLERKTAALRAHRSQVTVDGTSFSLSSGPARPIATTERFARASDAVPERIAWKDQGLGVHILAYVLALILGLAFGSILTINHQLTVSILGWEAPVGIVVTLAVVMALLVGSRLVFGGRMVALFAAIGLLGAIGVLSVASSGGGVLVPANVAGYLLNYGVVGIAVVVLVWPASGRFRRAKRPDSLR